MALVEYFEICVFAWKCANHILSECIACILYLKLYVLGTPQCGIWYTGVSFSPEPKPHSSRVVRHSLVGGGGGGLIRSPR